MRRSIVGVCMAMCLAVMAMSPVGASTTTVKGTGSYKKLVVNNGTKALVFKIHAPGGECDIKYLTVKFRDRDGTRYLMDGGCYPGAEWAASLVRGKNLVSCPKFTLRFNETSTVWAGKIPRTCLKGLDAAVKVTESYVDDYTPNINEVPATKYVKQG